MIDWREKVKGLKVAEGDGPLPSDLLFMGEALGLSEASWSTCPKCGYEMASEEMHGNTLITYSTCQKVTRKGNTTEVCGAKLVSTPKPFVGQSGTFLNRELGRVGLKRSEVHINNIIPIRPPDNNLSRLGELGLSLEDFLPRLTDLLKEVKPKIIVPVGNVALETLTGLSSITKRRGSLLRLGDRFENLLPGAWVVPMLHPAYIFRLPSKGRESYGVVHTTFNKDLRKIKRLLDNPLLGPPKRELKIEPTLTKIVWFLGKCEEDTNFITFDTELRKNQISCIAIAKSPYDALCIPIWEGWDSYWKEEEELVIWKLLKQFFEGPTWKVAHNVNFDIEMLSQHGINIKNVLLCSAAAHRVLWPELPRSLAYLGSVYTYEPFWKDDHKDQETGSSGWKIPKNDKLLWEYCARDAAVAYEIALEELKQIEKYKFEEQVWP